jgi:hypothetical protein
MTDIDARIDKIEHEIRDLVQVMQGAWIGYPQWEDQFQFTKKTVDELHKAFAKRERLIGEL